VGELRSPHSADPDFDSSYIAWDTYSVVRAIGGVIGGQQCAKLYYSGIGIDTVTRIVSAPVSMRRPVLTRCATKPEAHQQGRW